MNRTIQLKYRINEREVKKIKRAAEKNGLSVNQYAKLRALENSDRLIPNEVRDAMENIFKIACYIEKNPTGSEEMKKSCQSSELKIQEFVIHQK